ncbi:MAG TPA: hypothetical protein VMJ75_18095 [Candidatus Acidoferrales bacterium]|nr:hypothetical protein [Candidatus Acidoferrales bacterium]
MNKFLSFGIPALLMGAAAVWGQPNAATLVVTASNASANQLLVYNTAGQAVQTISTQGQGGASGNAGGIAAQSGLIAVVNFGSKNVTLFQHVGNGFQVRQLIPAASSPLSVAFGHGHLYILGTTKVESHQIFGVFISSSPDGVVPLKVADGSAAQVGVVQNQLIITEKSNVIETVNLMNSGAVGGMPTLVANIPANVNTPFGLVTRGDDAYVTIAHADEISLVRNDTVLTVTPSGTQHAPCWLTLVGPFLFSSNSPSMTVSRYAVYGQKIVQDAAVAASLQGAPTDIASGEGFVAVVDGFTSPTAGSHLTIFAVDEDGVLTSKGVVTTTAPLNGVAIIGAGDRF